MTGESLYCYAVLGVPVTASVAEITARYKALLAGARSRIASRQIDAQEIARLREAYLALRDAQNRAPEDGDVPQERTLSRVDIEVGEALA